MNGLLWKIRFQFRTLREDFNERGITGAMHALYVRNIKSNGFLCSIIGHRWTQDEPFSKWYCKNCLQRPSREE